MSLADKDKRIWAKGLAVACPFGDPLDSCIGNKLRELPLQERLKIIDNMSDEEIDAILEAHKCCLAHREKDLFGKS